MTPSKVRLYRGFSVILASGKFPFIRDSNTWDKLFGEIYIAPFAFSSDQELKEIYEGDSKVYGLVRFSHTKKGKSTGIVVRLQ